jgi:DNA-binding transcriptional MerR regulator
MKDKEGNALVKISELAKAAEVSVSTIHYYIQQGLLTPPVKTSRNMAYYQPQAAQEIRFIQELQAKRFLPLFTIKLIMQAKREGQRADHILEMSSLMEDVFRPVGNESKPANISFSELVSASGLSESDLKALEDKGLIIPVDTNQGLRYNDLDLRLTQLFRKLAGFGLKPDDLDIYRQYIGIIRLEARAMHEAFHRLPNHDQIPLREVLKTLKDFKECLEMKIFRDEAGHFNEHDFHPERKK